MIDQFHDLGPLPFPGCPRRGESGKGFMLRMAEMNRLELYEFYNLLGLDPKCAIRPQDVPILARIFDCAVADFDDLVMARNYAAHCVRRHTFQGHLLTRLYLFDLRHPKVCPCCLGEYGFARVEWDFGLFLWCPIHRCALIERCGACGRQMSWFRPGVSICVCSRKFVDVTEGSDVSWQVKTMALAMSPQDLAGRCSFPDLPADCWSILGVLSVLSTDGVMRLIWMLGTAQGRNVGLASGRRRASLAEAAAIIEAGIDHLLALLQRIGAGEAGAGARTGLLLRALERMKEDGATEGDCRFAASVVESLFRPRLARRPSNDERQLTLSLEERA